MTNLKVDDLRRQKTTETGIQGYSGHKRSENWIVEDWIVKKTNLKLFELYLHDVMHWAAAPLTDWITEWVGGTGVPNKVAG